jgi:hypothetical protein
MAKIKILKISQMVIKTRKGVCISLDLEYLPKAHGASGKW